LRRHILGRIKPKLCLFGHLHNNEDLINAGVVKYAAYITTFSNGSVVTDKKFGVVTSHGNILEI
jgi:Icc-related predicted phosphoesterase